MLVNLMKKTRLEGIFKELDIEENVIKGAKFIVNLPQVNINK